MRTFLALTAALVASLALASGVVVDTGRRFEFTDCASGGSASQNVNGGTYLMRVTDADVFLCWAGTCAAGGEKFPSGTVMLLTVPGFPSATTAFSCRSTGSNADVILTSAN